MALNSGIQTYQILTNNDEVCIPSVSNILLAVTLLNLTLLRILQIDESQSSLTLQLNSNPFNQLRRSQANNYLFFFDNDIDVR